MPISQGTLNTSALYVPNAYINVLAPSAQYLNGIPTNVLGLVGTASWGPVNSPVVVGTPGQAQAVFGPIQNRLNDLSTPLNIAAQQGASNFVCVRVTDGTDTAAAIAVLTNCVTFTSKYTGSFGNGIVVTISTGSQANSYQVVVSAPGLVPESFNNLGSGLSGNALWLAIAAAINGGNTAFRGPSNIIVATAGVGTTVPSLTSYTLAGGTDGVTSITTSVMLGVNTVPRTGMYALQSTGASVALLADLSDTTSFAAQAAFGLQNGIYMIGTTPSGDTIANAVATKSSAGIDSYGFKYCFGDWVYWLDTYNNVQRVVSPQGFYGGLLANLSPQNPSLNRQMQAVIGTQKSYSNQQYAQADLQQLVLAGIDVIANPSPGGAYFSAQFGHNSSSNQLIHSDAYTRVTNYLAATLNAGMGQFVGQLNSATVQGQALATISAFLDTLQAQGVIGNAAGTTPYSVQINAANNPPSQVALGYLQINVQVQYLAVVEFLIVNVQAGASVQIQSNQTIPQ